MDRQVKMGGAVALVVLGVTFPVLAQDKPAKKIAIATIVEVPQLLDTRDGVLEGLAENGYSVGRNLTVDYQNANGNIATMQQIARKFVANEPDAIVPMTTPATQAAVAATKTIPVIFGSVVDPLKARVISSYEKPSKNVTGVSEIPPVAQQIELFKQIMPEMKRLGYIYNTGLDSSLATLEWVEEAAKKYGITIVQAAVPTTNEVIPATQSLIGKVDAIYLPNDTTVLAALETIVRIGFDTKTPVFTGETRGVERGAVASLGLNYFELGKLVGGMTAQVLDGKEVGQIDALIASKVMTEFPIFINKKSADKMQLTIPQSVLDKASEIIE
ncbi:ABC transporter substrate-binding protein [Ochrobactrum vermis]|uniref:ABC transporter substrate-binding protein n=1 Tax=Ochrobactrum vermis TaxID=1827297 RepID=A0ABU8PM06_9HYPH|nr:ABC transporter substrate-binding protein [Ochrobactrum vermis]PQZ24440.1 ABC transporter permease [Ochrobactrum vermis]